MGGPQVNGMQLLAAGQADFIMGYDLQVLKSIEQGLPVITVAASFQKDPQGMVTHEDVNGLADLKGKTDAGVHLGPHHLVALAQEPATAYTDDADAPLHLQPAALLRRQERGAAGLPVVRAVPRREGRRQDRSSSCSPTTAIRPTAPPSSPRRRWSKDKPDLVQRFVRASMEGWKSYLADPAAGNALIKQDNPKMNDELIAYRDARR